MSLNAQITRVFEDSDPEGALVSIRDGSLRDSYPMDDLYKVSLITRFFTDSNISSAECVHGTCGVSVSGKRKNHLNLSTCVSLVTMLISLLHLFNLTLLLRVEERPTYILPPQTMLCVGTDLLGSFSLIWFICSIHLCRWLKFRIGA